MLLSFFTISAPIVHAEFTSSAFFWPRLAFDDNRRLREGSSPSNVASLTDLTVSNLWSRPTYSVNFSPKFRFIRYSKEKVLDSEDYFIVLGGQKIFEKQALSLQFAFEEEGTATSELTDSGRFDTNLRRESVRINGSWTYTLSNRMEFSLSGGTSHVSFEEALGSGFVDFESSNVSIGTRYNYSDTTAWKADATVSAFLTPDLNSETIGYSFNLGVEHDFTETTRVDFSIGQNISNLKFEQSRAVLLSLAPVTFGTVTEVFRERASSQILNALVTHEYERGEASVTWGRFLNPSSQGARQKRQEVEAIADYEVNMDWRAEVMIRYREQEQEGGLTTRFGALNIFSAGLRFFYRINEQARAEIGYRYLRQQQPDIGFVASSNEILFGIRYNTDRIVF